MWLQPVPPLQYIHKRQGVLPNIFENRFSSTKKASALQSYQMGSYQTSSYQNIFSITEKSYRKKSFTPEMSSASLKKTASPLKPEPKLF